MITQQNWVIASSNNGKITEINNLLKQYNINLRSQNEFNITDIPETGTTFIENALIKARHACTHTNLPALADDSGLVVPSLNGEPGIYSARYAGTKDNHGNSCGDSKDNIKKLIHNLKQLPDDITHHEHHKYYAYFYCVIVLLQYPSDPTPLISEGIWHGEIILKPKGTAGFGYDSIFYDPKMQMTAAQMTLAQKQAHSHRGQALRELLNNLK
jgi:XTP/dITP diphosphohydrolase